MIASRGLTISGSGTRLDPDVVGAVPGQCAHRGPLSACVFAVRRRWRSRPSPSASSAAGARGGPGRSARAGRAWRSRRRPGRPADGRRRSPRRRCRGRRAGRGTRPAPSASTSELRQRAPGDPLALTLLDDLGERRRRWCRPAPRWSTATGRRPSDLDLADVLHEPRQVLEVAPEGIELRPRPADRHGVAGDDGVARRRHAGRGRGAVGEGPRPLELVAPSVAHAGPSRQDHGGGAESQGCRDVGIRASRLARSVMDAGGGHARRFLHMRRRRGVGGRRRATERASLNIPAERMFLAWRLRREKRSSRGSDVAPQSS